MRSKGRSESRTAVAALVAASAVLVAGPVHTAGRPADRTGTEAATRWVTGFVESGTPEEQARYLAADVAYDWAGADRPTEGRSEYLRAQEDRRTGPTTTGVLYLDRSGAALLDPVEGRDVLVVLEIGADGVQRRTDLEPLPGRADTYTSGPAGTGVWPQRLWVLEGSAGCPGRVLEGMELDEAGHVIGRRTLRLAADVRRCGDDATGWWSGRALPERLGTRVTGTLHTPAGSIEIRNGSDVLQDAVREEVRRFEGAGLGTPGTPAVVFDPYDQRCARYRGWFDLSTHVVLVCHDADTRCSHGDCWADRQVRTLLRHELAHAWVTGHVDAEERERFLAAVGLERWNEVSDHHDRRGIEWAADVLAWALSDDHATTPATLRHPDCRLLVAGYAVLTGRSAPVTCP